MKIFLNHQTYEDLKNLIGPEATTTLANRYNGQTLYFPALTKEGRANSPVLANGLSSREVRSFICGLRRDGATAVKIGQAIKEEWPEDQTKWVSKSALGRFMVRVREGRMREFGIDDMFREINEIPG